MAENQIFHALLQERKLKSNGKLLLCLVGLPSTKRVAEGEVFSNYSIMEKRHCPQQANLIVHMIYVVPGFFAAILKCPTAHGQPRQINSYVAELTIPPIFCNIPLRV